MQNNINSQTRLLDIYLFFKKGNSTTSKDLAQSYNTTTRTITRDIQNINKIIVPDEIVFNKSKNMWVISDTANSIFLDKEEQLILNILDKACVEQGKDFHQKALNLFDKFKDSLHNTIYNNIDSEDISTIKLDLAKVENAIYNKNKISLIYNDKQRTIDPLKLANFDGYWYLIVKDTTIKALYFKDISNIKILDEKYIFTDTNTEQILKNAINTYFRVDVVPYEINIFVSKDIAKIFKRKPISKTQQIIKQYDDGSYDLRVFITNDMELIPKIQQFIPYLTIIDQDKNSKRIINQLIKNIELFQYKYKFD